MMTPIIYSGLAVGLIVSLILMFYPKSENPNNRFLGYSLFWMWYVLLINLLNSTEQMLLVPQLFRTGLVSGYLIMPFLYIYTRNTFTPGISWRKRDWLLLVPAAFYLLDYIPFMLKPSSYKIQVIMENINKPQMFQTTEGWLTPSGFHYAFIYVWSLFLFVLQALLLLRNRKMENNGIAKQNRALYSFLVVITILFSPSLFPGIFGAVFHLGWYSLEFISVSLSITLITAAIFLLFSPQVLYGFYPALAFTLSPESHSNKLVSSEIDVSGDSHVGSRGADVTEINATKGNAEIEPPRYIDEETEEKLWQSLIALFEETNPFLNSSYTIHDLSKDIRIPVYQLSPLINRRAGSNFSQWINRYRIEYFLELALSNEFENLTQEALAQRAGFNSRVTFNNAFKKEKGLAPSAYLKSTPHPKND